MQVFPIPPETEVVVFTLSQHRSQGLLDKAEIHEHFRQSRKFLFHDGLLKLDAGGGDGNRVSHEAVGPVKVLGKEASDQVCHGLASADLRFAEGDFPVVQTVEDGQSHFVLLLPEGVAMLRHKDFEDDVHELHGGIGVCSLAPGISGVLDGVEDLRSDIRILGCIHGCFPFQHPGCLTGGAVQGDILEHLSSGSVEDIVAVSKSKIVDGPLGGLWVIQELAFFICDLIHDDRPPVCCKVDSRMLCRRLPSCTVFPPPTNLS